MEWMRFWYCFCKEIVIKFTFYDCSKSPYVYSIEIESMIRFVLENSF